MTKYRVLAKVDGQSRWHELPGEYEATNDEAAIKAALTAGNGAGDPSGEYVAVPLRSWHPRKVETKQAFSFS